MTDNNQGARKTIGYLVIFGMVVLLCLAGWTVFVELFSVGADPGQAAPSGKLPPVDVIHSIQNFFLHLPVFGAKARDLLQTGASLNPEAGPQAVWRSYITWWGVLMIGAGLLMLVVKHLVEPTNDETTTMHLKGDTDTALRAKGGRG